MGDAGAPVFAFLHNDSKLETLSPPSLTDLTSSQEEQTLQRLPGRGGELEPESEREEPGEDHQDQEPVDHSGRTIIQRLGLLRFLLLDGVEDPAGDQLDQEEDPEGSRVYKQRLNEYKY